MVLLCGNSSNISLHHFTVLVLDLVRAGLLKKVLTKFLLSIIFAKSGLNPIGIYISIRN